LSLLDFLGGFKKKFTKNYYLAKVKKIYFIPNIFKEKKCLQKYSLTKAVKSTELCLALAPTQK
jgi:hypothetical protein